MNNTHTKDIPSIKTLLNKDTLGKNRKYIWNYRRVVGIVNYLERTTRPDIDISVHQLESFL